MDGPGSITSTTLLSDHTNSRDLNTKKCFIILKAPQATPPQDDKDSFGKLPVEVNLMILELLNANDLGSARLINKRLGAIGSKLLCRNVHVMETTESLKRLKTITDQDTEITKSVKHLHYIALQCTDREFYTEAAYKNWWYLVERRRPLTSDQELTSIYRKYDHFWAHTDVLRDTRAPTRYMEEIFRTLRPKSITISGFQNKERMNHKLYKSLFDITMPPPSTSIFNEYLKPCHWGGRDERWYRTWLNGLHNRALVDVLLAVEASGLALQTLTVRAGPAFLIHHSLPRLEKAIESIEYLDLSLILGGLGRLFDDVHLLPVAEQLTLPNLAQIPLFHYHNNEGKLALIKFLGRAKELKALRLRVTKAKHRPEDFIKFGGLSLARLEYLQLNLITCEKDDLLNFILSHARTLRTLDLANIRLFLGTTNDAKFPRWVDIFQQLLENVRNGVLALDNVFLSGTFGRAWRTPGGELMEDKGDEGYEWPNILWTSKACVKIPFPESSEPFCSHRKFNFYPQTKRPWRNRHLADLLEEHIAARNQWLKDQQEKAEESEES